MKLILLTRFHSHNQHSMGGNPLALRLAKAGLMLGHELQIVNPGDVVLDFANATSEEVPLRWNGQPYPDADLTLPLARWDDAHTWQVAETLLGWGKPVCVSERVPLGDHVTMARLLARRGIPSPRSWVLNNPHQLAILLSDLTFPIMLRSRFGGSGRKVAVVQHSGEAMMQAEQLSNTGQPFMVQELPQPLGQDIRLLVIGEQVVAAVSRQAAPGFVRPKEEGNPQVVATDVAPEEAKIALAAAKLYGAPFCAVNLLRSAHQGPLLLEVSRVPTLGELERATGQDLATLMVQHLESLAQNQAEQNTHDATRVNLRVISSQ